MHQHGALGTHFHTQLTNGFKERLRFDVAYRTADFNQSDIRIARAFDDTTLNFIRNVRNNLNRSAQIITTALFTQHVHIDAACGEVVILGHRGANESLIVTEV